MGKLISLSTNKIKPSQNYLKERTVKFILTCFYENRKDLLPPAPIVRHDKNNDAFIAIDGHNLIAIYDLFGQDMEVYVAENSKDKLTREAFPESSEDGLKSRNQELEEKYEGVIKERARLYQNNICSLSDLRAKYPYLESKETAKEFYNKNRETFIANFL